MTRSNSSARSTNVGKRYGEGSSKEGEKGFPVGRTFIIKDTPRLRCFWIPRKHADVARDSAVLRSPLRTVFLSLSLFPFKTEEQRKRVISQPQRIALKRSLFDEQRVVHAPKTREQRFNDGRFYHFLYFFFSFFLFFPSVSSAILAWKQNGPVFRRKGDRSARQPTVSNTRTPVVRFLSRGIRVWK